MTAHGPPPPPPTGAPTTPVTHQGPVTPHTLPVTPRVVAGRAEKPTITLPQLGALLAAAFLVDLALRSGVNNLAGTLGVLALGACILAGGRLRQRAAIVLVAGAMLLAPWLAIRASEGLSAVTILAIGGLLALGTGVSRSGRFALMRATAMLTHLVAPPLEALWYGLPMVQRLFATGADRTLLTSLARGLLFAVPVFTIFAILLASADEVFANLLLIDDLPSIVSHIVVTLVVAIGFLGYISRAAHETPPADPRLARVISPVEVNVVLGSVAVLFAAFVATQFAVALGGVDHVLETEGLTQAEHARRGFFQLLWVAALTLGLLGVFRSVRSTDDERHRDRFVPLATAILVLALVITGISIQRLSFYVGSFGLTPLRLWSLATAGWIGVLIVVYGLSIHWAERQPRAPESAGDTRSWFPAFLVGSAAVFVFGLNVANPDAFVARYNIDHTPGEELDVRALTELSADVIPVLTDGGSGAGAGVAEQTKRQLCAREVGEQRYGVLGWNRADAAERRFLADNCAGRPPE